jgi:tetratricopeptide (TPR) repeat protein
MRFVFESRSRSTFDALEAPHMTARRRPHFDLNSAQAQALLRTARDVHPQDELSADGASIRQLMDRVSQCMGATPESVETPQPLAAADGDLSKRGTELLAALNDGQPADSAESCLRIAEWAEKRNALSTAAFFFEAAAAFDPDNAALVNRTGKLAMRRADYDAARAWYQRGIELGKAGEDWDAVAVGWSGLGAIARRSGEDPQDAAVFHMRSLALARKHGLPVREAEGFHALAVLSVEQQRYHEGITHARNALDIYGRNQPQILILANDLAWLWMDRDRAYSRVLPIFRQCVRSAETPAHRVIMLGNLARAAAGIGDRAEFHQAEADLVAALPESFHLEGHADGLLELAKGAALLGLAELSRRYATEAAEAAVKRREAKLAEEAGEFLKRLDRPEPLETASPSPSTHTPVEQRMDDLAMELVLAMR